MLARRLLAFTRMQPVQRRLLDVNAVITELSPMLRRLIGDHIDLAVLPRSSECCIEADASELEQVIINLVLNARDATPAGGCITIETENVDVDGPSAAVNGVHQQATYVSLIVRDTGCGISQQALSQIFEPFFTTKAAGKGTGLGLYTVHEIVQQYRGAIRVESEEGQGTLFKILLPQAGQHLASTGSTGPNICSQHGSETLLLVEDDESLRGFLQNLLQVNGYTVLEAADGKKAVDVFRQHKPLIHLLITDVMMPKLCGPELAQTISPECPEMKVLFMTGYPDCLVTNSAVLGADVAFLQKPFTAEELLSCVRGLLDGSLDAQDEQATIGREIAAA